MTNCARPFQPLSLDTRRYSQVAGDRELQVQVIYDTFDILVASGNFRYARKAKKHNLKFLPIKLFNPTKDTLFVNQSELRLFGEYEALPSTDLKKLRRVRQVSWPYLLLLLTDYGLRQTTGDAKVATTFLFPLGTSWGVGNFAVARFANQRFKREIRRLTTLPVGVPPQQIKYILLPVAADQVNDQLQLRYEDYTY